jgi:uncharacterized protein YegL
MRWPKLVVLAAMPLAVLAGSCGRTSSSDPDVDDPSEKETTGGSSNGVGVGSSSVCVPGDSKACVGPAGCQGHQVCSDDGARYDACQCAAGAGGTSGGASGSGGTSGGAGGAGGSSGTSGGSGGTSGGAGGSGGITTDAGTAGGAGGSADACANTVFVREPVPFDMFVLLDQSGSMNGSRWEQVTGAIQTFVQSPASAGIGIGIQYFPIDGNVQCISNGNPPGCTCLLNMCFYTGSTTCDVEDYATPDVAIQPLPGAAEAIIDSLAAHSPGGGTPTLPALQGAMQYVKTHAEADPSREVIIVLVTDGQPNDCNSTVTNVADVAAAGFAEAPSIRTYVVGIGSVDNLNTIAEAGGTGEAFIIDDATADQGLLDVLNTIRGGCSFKLPTPPDGSSIDPARVDVTFTPDGGAPQVLPRVTSADGCDAGGWYYEDPSQPADIVVCPEVCSFLVSTPGSLEIVVRCQ